MSCSYKGEEEVRYDKQVLALSIQLLRNQSANFLPPECKSPPYSFAKLGSSGFNSSCGRSGCHDGTIKFNTQNYSSVVSLTKASEPENSQLYLKQFNGSMRIYSNAQISEAIYCWIKAGSNL